MNTSSVEEAIQFAIEQEIQAAELYSSLLEKSTDPKAQEIYAELRDMEIIHKENLENFDHIEFLKRHADQPLLDLKLTDYLVEKQPAENLSFQDTLILAAQREQKTYALYAELASKFEYDEILHNLFSLLAREEQLHKDQIEALYDETVLSQN
ncbi:MAG: ferritin family protein [Candidatus Marinimicrobia bacterium]|nr:ferritin family protein [Candidatus Neomarinimicrobiota bacterium]